MPWGATSGPRLSSKVPWPRPANSVSPPCSLETRPPSSGRSSGSRPRTSPSPSGMPRRSSAWRRGPPRPSGSSGTPPSAAPASGAPPGGAPPASAAAPPSLSGFTVLIDAGANVDPKPRHLFQWAVMGHVYSRDIIGKDNPRVGILSVGQEEGKGNELVKETYEALRGSSLNFIGNVEGRDIYNGHCDVVVTDGFTGNVCLKISESLAEMLTSMIREELTRDFFSKAGAALSRAAFARMKRRGDYTEMGGGAALGGNGGPINFPGGAPRRGP